MQHVENEVLIVLAAGRSDRLRGQSDVVEAKAERRGDHVQLAPMAVLVREQDQRKVRAHIERIGELGPPAQQLRTVLHDFAIGDREVDVAACLDDPVRIVPSAQLTLPEKDGLAADQNHRGTCLVRPVQLRSQLLEDRASVLCRERRRW